ncbi:22993_t:CDS:2 [Gigaspora margarita]|uniref:22993_t:CDS:1 n=1 Tax=Gigaspora margarita TaxID=4874 RepID=A0ABN7UIK1_GIGMA|nr:22993_t:CDS:2 [Gigaspora margarita]
MEIEKTLLTQKTRQTTIISRHKLFNEREQVNLDLLYALTAADIPLEKAEKLKLLFLNKYCNVAGDKASKALKDLNRSFQDKFFKIRNKPVAARIEQIRSFLQGGIIDPPLSTQMIHKFSINNIDSEAYKIMFHEAFQLALIFLQVNALIHDGSINKLQKKSSFILDNSRI